MKLLELEIYNEKQSRLNGYNLETLAFSLAKKFNKEKKQYCIVFSSLYECQLFSTFLQNFILEENICYYLFDEVLRVDFMGVSKEMQYERMRALNKIYTGAPVIIIFNAISLLRPVIDKKSYIENSIVLEKNSEYSRKKIIDLLANNGYRLVSMVEHPGEFAYRGMIFDFFPPNYINPIRLEFEGNTLIDIREFNVAKEISINSLERAEITPAYDLIYDNKDRENIINTLENELKGMNEFDDTYFALKNKIVSIVDEEDDKSVPYNHHRYFGSFRSIVSYVDNMYFYNKDDILFKLDNYVQEDKEFFTEQYNHRIGLANDSLIVNKDSVMNSLSYQEIEESSEGVLRDIPYVFDSIFSLPNILRTILSDGYKVFIVQDEKKIGSIKEHLDNAKLIYTDYPYLSDIIFINGNLSKGFMDSDNKIIFIGYKEIYGINRLNNKFLSRYKEVESIKKFDELNEGDYVVHEKHGIGKYIGVVIKDGLEMLQVNYRDDDKLYIPLIKFGMLKKYAGREGYVPRLDVLGGSSWQRRKAKIKSRLTYLTDQLLEISSKRKAEKGYAFIKNEELENEFANSFPYELTSSQQTALKEISSDQEKDSPMDRLLAGDVGFGKTELAFRAAFKTVLSGKQVVFLCPTTLLAKQHYEVAIHRFKGFGVKIACFSRLISIKEQNDNIQKIKDGKIDIIIGTHRLLSDDIEYKAIGLLIVDEEQRFGVAQKEKIKKIGGNIDVLTLTATPIPRTLQMSLLGLRELSRLIEPPQNRLPIKTYVTAYNEGLIKEAINLELGRKGQVYYLHNKVKTIYTKANDLKRIFPSARIGVAHGKMTSSDVNAVMNDFYDGNIDILVCTTIIETGLDLANVNTIIIEEAINYGLAQLYQIKGRVGRSDRMAYAYLFYNKFIKMNEDARKRLKSIKEFTELGSGYKIANQDLNIRGAGDILGAEQAGFMDTLGYDAYQELLNEVIKQKNEVCQAKVEVSNKYMLSFSLDCCIPNEYADEKNRIKIYRELMFINNIYDLDEFAKKIRDVYGPYTQEVYNLLCKREIEILLNSDFVYNFTQGLDYYIIEFSERLFKMNIKMNDINSIVEPLLSLLYISISHNHLIIRLRKNNSYIENLLYLTNRFIKVFLSND